MEDGIKFKRTVIDLGGSAAVTIPIELLNFLNMKKTDKAILVGENGKHGNFIALWKLEEESEEDKTE